MGILISTLDRSLNDAFWQDFERLTPYVRDLSKKQAVTAQSLEKIEDGDLLTSAFSN